MRDELEELMAESSRKQEQRASLRAEIRELYDLEGKLRAATGKLKMRRTYLEHTDTHVQHIKRNILTLTGLPKDDPLYEVPEDFTTQLAREAVNDRPDREAERLQGHVEELTAQLETKRAVFVDQLRDLLQEAEDERAAR